MGLFSEVRRGYRAGRATREQQHDEPPSDFARDGFADGMGALRDENANLRAQLTQMQDESAHTRAQIRELESILAFPGTRTALVKALHPDTGTGGSNASRTEIFQKLVAVMERLGIRG
jgi:hypothetical protein